jgi:predicted metal-dependent hydrolase
MRTLAARLRALLAGLGRLATRERRESRPEPITPPVESRIRPASSGKSQRRTRAPAPGLTMQKSPTPRPNAALDNRQLDLPLFAEPAPVGLPASPTLTPTPAPTPGTSGKAPLAPDGTRLRTIVLGARTLHYRLKRSSRKSIGFAIDGTGLSITAPRWVTIADIETAIAEKQRWIFAKLAEWQTRTEQRALPRVEWGDGAELPFLGKPIRVKLGASLLAFDEETRVLALPLPPHADSQQIKDRVTGWLQGEATRIFGERLAVYAERLGVTFRSYALSSAATRWGSCSSEGRIRLNWRLIHFPLSVVDYVVAHELAHLREMNHSPRFWQTVESIFPEFREARKQLKQHPVEM